MEPNLEEKRHVFPPLEPLSEGERLSSAIGGRSRSPEKLQKTHYESFLEMSKKLYGISPLSEVAAAVKRYPDYVPGNLDDRPYRDVCIQYVKGILRKIKAYPETMIASLTTEMIYARFPELLSEFRSYLNLLHHVDRFSRHRMVFRFEEALTAKLLYTDIHKVDSSFLRVPYSSFFISIPHNQDLKIRNQHTGMHRVTGIYVSYTEDMATLNSHYPDEEKDADGIHPELKREGVPFNKALRIFAVADKNENALHEADDATFFMTLFFAPGDVFPQVEEMLRKYSVVTEMEEDLPRTIRLFEFILNALLYINSPSADFERVPAKYDTGKDKVASDKKNAHLSKIGVVSTGSHVYLSHEYRLRYREGTLGQLPQASVDAGTPVWLVRGHYRNQAHGPNRVLRTLIWIHPYVKGKGILDEEQVIPRQYTTS